MPAPPAATPLPVSRPSSTNRSAGCRRTAVTGAFRCAGILRICRCRRTQQRAYRDWHSGCTRRDPCSDSSHSSSWPRLSAHRPLRKHLRPRRLQAATPGGDVTRATLDNGLRVVIVRDPLAPVVTVEENYLVGANETPPGFPGMAHAQEHMAFRDAPASPQTRSPPSLPSLAGSTTPPLSRRSRSISRQCRQPMSRWRCGWIPRACAMSSTRTPSGSRRKGPSSRRWRAISRSRPTSSSRGSTRSCSPARHTRTTRSALASRSRRRRARCSRRSTAGGTRRTTPSS